MNVRKLIDFLEDYGDHVNVCIIDAEFNERFEILELDDFNGPVLVIGEKVSDR